MTSSPTEKRLPLSSFCDHRHRKSARATESGFGPLHVRETPMPVLDWDALSDLVHQAGADLGQIWDTASAPYRDEVAADLVYAEDSSGLEGRFRTAP